MKASLTRRLGQLEMRGASLPFSHVVRPRPGQTTADAVAEHLCRFGNPTRPKSPTLVVVPMPSLSAADWLRDHAPVPP